MRKLYFFLLFIIITSLSCKKDKSSEDDPFENITVAQTQQSLVMVGTATWCPYCGQWGDPAFYAGLKGKTNEYIKTTVDSTRVNGLEVHPTNSPADPLYNLISKALDDSLGIGESIPGLWADFQNCWAYPTRWNDKIKDTQAKTNPTCALGMKKVLKDNIYTVYVKIKFFTPQTGVYRIAVYAVEDNLIAKQNVAGSGYDTKYVHHNVLRAEITNNTIMGERLFSVSSQPEYKLTYSYTVPAGQKADNIKFVGAIYKMYGKVPWYSPNSCTTR